MQTSQVAQKSETIPARKLRRLRKPVASKNESFGLNCVLVLPTSFIRKKTIAARNVCMFLLARIYEQVLRSIPSVCTHQDKFLCRSFTAVQFIQDFRVYVYHHCYRPRPFGSENRTGDMRHLVGGPQSPDETEFREPLIFHSQRGQSQQQSMQDSTQGEMKPQIIIPRHYRGDGTPTRYVNTRSKQTKTNSKTRDH